MPGRLFDRAAASMGLLVGAIPLACTALALRLSGVTPVLFRQTRIGRGGKPFDLYKLRTMRATGGAAITIAGDARVTPMGRIARRWKLDELPQLWNVLRGDLRIVGPRPEVEHFVRSYSPAQRRILDVTPGLASMSQLVYPHEAELLRGCADPEAAYRTGLMPLKIACDLEYEARRTAVTDLQLIVEVLLLVLGWRTRAAAPFDLAERAAAAGAPGAATVLVEPRP